MNELYFLVHSLVLALTCLYALRLGKEALVTFIAMQTVLANFFVTKQISLCGFNATAADPFIIGSALSLNLLQEYFGKNQALKAIKITFFMLICYGFFSFMHLAYVPSCYDVSNVHFNALLSFAPRLVVASLLVYWITSQLDTALYAVMRQRYAHISTTMRNAISVGITQAADTLLFTVLGLWGILSNLTEIMIVSYIIKLSCIALVSICMAAAKRVMPPTSTE
ncbi:hypothetical protein Noda2021_10130 [Candidatus Dependentiae bacterium Noda2021]|nr:hypothetical protein Noda2021_10130 [Candidatus Dependentiae bacterium Noda2021]